MLTSGQIRAARAFLQWSVAELAEKRGATRFYSLIEIADFLNNN